MNSHEIRYIIYSCLLAQGYAPDRDQLKAAPGMTSLSLSMTKPRNLSKRIWVWG